MLTDELRDFNTDEVLAKNAPYTSQALRTFRTKYFPDKDIHQIRDTLLNIIVRISHE